MANITGGPGDDQLNGTAGPDRIHGNGGSDLLSGLGGADQLYGDTGDDRLYGGTGNDRLDGGAGRDTAIFYGEAGHVLVDLVHGTAQTSAGIDQMASIERVHGTAGDDFMFGVDTSTFDGWASVSGSLALFGREGDDTILGGSGADHLEGNDGDDELSGYRGADHLRGGAGSDAMDGGSGLDLLVGGKGDDLFQYALTATDDDLPFDRGGGQDIVADFARGHDQLAVSVNNDVAEIGFLFVSGKDVFTALDSNHDGKISGADQWADLKNVNVDGVAKAALVLDIGAGVGLHLFGANGQDTLALLGVTSLSGTDFHG